jgi:hypothetical protein
VLVAVAVIVLGYLGARYWRHMAAVAAVLPEAVEDDTEKGGVC